MKKKRLEKLVINRETLRKLNVEETRQVVGGADSCLSDAEESCAIEGARGRIPVG
jgi:hypothetical protein